MALSPSNQPKKQRAQSEAKYPHLVEHLAAQIRCGKLGPGDRLPTFVQLQEAFSVTPHTVNRAMIALEHQGLIVRQSRMGIFVSNSNRPKSKGIIGLSGFGFRVGDSSFYWTRLLQGIHHQAQAAGAQVLLLQGVREGWEKVDGVVLSNAGDECYSHAIPAQLPVVCLFSSQQERASVSADEYAGVRLAIEHLLALGHERIAFLHGQNRFLMPARLKGYEDALRGAGIAPRKNWVRRLSGENNFSPQFTAAGRSDVAAWLSDKSRNGWQKIGCTALLCHNDETAIGALRALNEAGLKVPDDVSVVGFDGTDMGEYSSPQLTSVEMPLQQMGKVAIQTLQKQIAADEVFVEHQVLPTQLRVRQSTSAPSHH